MVSVGDKSNCRDKSHQPYDNFGLLPNEYRNNSSTRPVLIDFHTPVVLQQASMPIHFVIDHVPADKLGDAASSSQ